MRFFNSSVFFIALRYIKGSRKQRFATFVALLATVGIAIGVSALIVVSSIMQGLQERLKSNILSETAHVVVKADKDDIPKLLNIPGVVALIPFVQGEALIQSGKNITMVNLQGMRNEALYVSNDFATKLGLTTSKRSLANFSQNALDREVLFCISVPENNRAKYDFGAVFNFKEGQFDLAVNHKTLNLLEADLFQNNKVRITSTQNARYTPLGLTPIQRNFTLKDTISSLDNSSVPTVIGNYVDIKRFLRISAYDSYFRLYLEDPFIIDKVTPYLDNKFEYTDWRLRYGEFFKAVGLERVTMSTMLCLIILVAAFNILSSLTMVVSARVSEIAILKTLGLSSSALLSIFIIVGMSASIVGSILGMIIGIPFAIYSQEILSFLGISIVSGKLPVSIDISNVLLIILLCIIISIICTLYPAYRASRTDPAKNLVNS